jgi:FkbM family methyltransferase
LLSEGIVVAGGDLGNKFRLAVERLHASPIKKLGLVGPRRFLTRRYARFFGSGTEREAELFFGGAMTVVLPEVISQQIYTYGLFDEIVTGLALRAVRQGDVVLDIGAHFGYFTLLFSRLVGESGRVVSFEPTPSTFAVLQKNTVDVSNVTILNMAAGRESGRLTISDFGLTYSAWNTLSASSRMPGMLAQPKARVDVEVIRLDDWCERESIQPTVIKIDAENFETEVIGGLAETLSWSHPRVLMETGSEQAIQAGLALLDLDYQVLVSTQPGVLTLQKDGVEEALIRNKDVLFVPAAQVTEFMGRA